MPCRNVRTNDSGSTAARRRALADALIRARRSTAIRPELSVEQAAADAGVGVAWYRALEDASDVGLSAASLGWVAQALHIRGAARARLFELAGIDPGIELTPFAESVPSSLQPMLDALLPLPAYLVGRRADLLALNDAAEALYRCHLVPQARRNAYLLLFTQPEIRKLIANWRELARLSTCELRLAVTQAAEDPVLADLRQYLELMSPDFRALWPAAEGNIVARTKVFAHPRVGRMVFDVHRFSALDDGSVAAMVYSPRPRDGTMTRLEKLVRSHLRNQSSRERRRLQAAVRRVKEHIDTCYQREVSLDELAALVATNRFLLLRAFAREVGYPPHAYQLLVRVFHARRLLSLGQTAASVAAAVGFSDQSHLIRHFKRIEGMTPAEYVRRYRARA